MSFVLAERIEEVLDAAFPQVDAREFPHAVVG
jgi:hypothetical protein